MPQSKRPIAAEDLNRIHYVQEPQISPSGQFVAFVKVTPDPLERGYMRNVWLYPLGGGVAFQLTRGDKDSQPSWSPDGNYLAFVSARGEKPQVYLLPTNGAGGEARALTTMANGAHSPAWSPDGKQIAFLAPESADERSSVDAGDSAAPPPTDKLEKRHRKERKAENEQHRWDPREMWRIPYRHGTTYVDERYDQIHVICIEETSESKPHRLTDINADHSRPRWSADGTSIFTARTSDPEGDEPWRSENVYRIDATTGQVIALTDGTSSTFAPTPSPDGKWLACGRRPIDITDIPMRLLVMAIDGSDIRIVNERNQIARLSNGLGHRITSWHSQWKAKARPCPGSMTLSATLYVKCTTAFTTSSKFDIGSRWSDGYDRLHTKESSGTLHSAGWRIRRSHRIQSRVAERGHCSRCSRVALSVTPRRSARMVLASRRLPARAGLSAGAEYPRRTPCHLGICHQNDVA